MPQSHNHVIDFNPYRQDFPILSQTMNGKPLAYLDSASSAQKPQVVLDTYKKLYAGHYANIHRGLYQFSQVITQEYEAVRHKVKNLINAPSDQEVVFTRNTTEAVNLVAHSWGRQMLNDGDEVILTEMEHHANIVPWQLLEKEMGIKLKVIPILENGQLDIEQFQNLLTDNTKLISFVHASNSLGVLNPVQEITAMAKNYNNNIVVLIDGSQSVVHTPINVQEIGCDFFVFTGHKLYGPNGVGVLWGHEKILNDMPPYQGGGDMIEHVSFSQTSFKKAPAKFEAGTPAIAEVIALGAAIDYIQAIGMTYIQRYENDLYQYLTKEVQTIEGIYFFGESLAKDQEKVSVLSFIAEWAHIADIAMILDQCGVAVRTGHHCCMPLMERYQIDGTVRVSLGLYSNQEDIDAFIQALKKAKDMLS